MPITSLAFVLFVTAILCALLALYTWQHRTVDGARLLVIILVACTLDMVAYGGELLADDLPGKLFFVQLRYLAIAISIPSFILAALWYAGHDQWLKPHRVALLTILPTLSMLILLTNDWHHLHYATVGLDSSAGFPAFAKTNGPLYWFYIAHSLAYEFIAVGIMLQTFFAASRQQRTQTGLVLLGTSVPLLATLIYLLGMRPYGFFNFTPLAFTTTGLTFGWAILRHRLLDLRPIAYSAVLDRIQIGVIILDATGRIVDLNHAAQGDLKVNAREVVGKPLAQATAQWQHLAEHFARGAPAHEDVVRELDGERRVFTVETSSLGTHADGQLVLLRDVTIHRQRERDALAQHRALTVIEEREKMARELHDGVAQVMGYMHTQTNVALDQLAHDQTELTEATLATMRDVAQDAHADLREFILGVRAGETPAKGFFVTLEKYLAQFRANYHLAVALSKPDDWDDDTLDPSSEVHLLRVIQEALTNARKHAHASHVQVMLTLTEHTGQVIVADDGQGFVPGEAEAGKHFGLQILRERMNDIGGTLEIRSVLGQGTQVIVQVPRTQPKPAHLNQLRVLIVDDQPLFSDGLRNLLAARGITVIGLATNGERALTEAHRLKPDLVLLDVHMPGMDGLTTLAQMKSELPQIKVVMLTASDEPAKLLEALNAGANGYLLKNLNPSEFFGMVEQVMRGEVIIAPSLATRIAQDAAAHTASEDLTPRQRRILALLAQDKTNREIADAYVLTEGAIKYHVGQILERLNVTTREQAVAEAKRRGWLNSE